MARSPYASRLLALAGSLALSACAHSPSTNEAPAMSTPAVSHAATDAPTLLKSMLELIRGTHRVQDITPERLRAVMGLQVETWGPTRFGFRGDVTPRWRYFADVDVARAQAPGMEFSFVPTAPGSAPDATDLCAFDLDAFDAALRSEGFQGEPHYGEHGEVLWQQYRRGQLSVEVKFQGETDAKATHHCVTSLVLR